MEAYWTEPGFDAYPPKGPETSLGLVIWNHGLKGKEVQYRSAPPLFVQGLAARGWDVIKLNRNPLWENTWENAGRLHIARLVEEVAAARTKGYRRIIIGGQSYGGAIALAAAGRIDGLWAVVATAPGTGQQTIYGSPTDKWTDAIVRQTYNQLRDIRRSRVVAVFPNADELVTAPRGAQARVILREKGDLPFIVVDETAPIKTHSGAYSAAFNAYGTCIGYFLDPAREPKPGEFACGHDEFDAASSVLRAESPIAIAPGGVTWFGYITTSGQEVAVTVHEDGAAGVQVEYASGPAVIRKFKSNVRTVRAQRQADILSFELPSGYAVTIRPGSNGSMEAGFVKNGQPPLSATLRPVGP
jgi:dienelactone hydrolase